MSLFSWALVLLVLLFGAALSGCPPHKPTPIAQGPVSSAAIPPAYGAPPATSE